jgi:pilus assembly protein Flp/PilA
MGYICALLTTCCYAELWAGQGRSRNVEMGQSMTQLRKLLADTQAATAIEYGLIAALIAVAAISAMGSLGSQLKKTLGNVTTGMSKG